MLYWRKKLLCSIRLTQSNLENWKSALMELRPYLQRRFDAPEKKQKKISGRPDSRTLRKHQETPTSHRYCNTALLAPFFSMWESCKRLERASVCQAEVKKNLITECLPLRNRCGLKTTTWYWRYRYSISVRRVERFAFSNGFNSLTLIIKCNFIS